MAVKPEAREKVLVFLRRGLYRSDAAKCAGITYETLRTWMREDPAFSSAVKKAESNSVDALAAKIEAAADDPKHWTAAAWLLERRNPKKYGKRERVEQRVSFDNMTDAELEAKARAIAIKYGAANAIQVTSPKAMDARNESGDGGKVGGGDSEGEEASREET